MPARSLGVLAALLSATACRPEPTQPVEQPNAEAGPTAPSADNEYAFDYAAGVTIYAYADPSLSGEVDRLFEVFAAMQAESFVIRDGGELPIGWTTLRFEVDGPRITVVEPDYGGDPIRDSRPDISVSLSTLARQRGVLNLVGVQGESIDFDRHVLIVRGVLERPDVFLVRVDSPGGRMTGWRLSPTEGMVAEDEVDSVPVYEILAVRPELVDAMLLPAGYMAFYEGERLVTLVDGSDQVVWDWARDGEAAPLGRPEPEQPDPGVGDPGLLPGLDR